MIIRKKILFVGLAVSGTAAFVTATQIWFENPFGFLIKSLDVLWVIAIVVAIGKAAHVLMTVNEKSSN